MRISDWSSDVCSSDLFGAELAYARSVPATAPAKTMAMDAYCMAMMAMHQPAPKEKTCKGLTLDCIAAMGCVVPLMAADLSGSIAAPHIRSVECRVGTECVSTCRSRLSPYH